MSQPGPVAALVWGAAIGTLGGLSGAEFCLPVLLGLFALAACAAVDPVVKPRLAGC